MYHKSRQSLCHMYFVILNFNFSSIATTKFEPVNARRAYPCMDEPNIKANYTTTLIHRPDYTPLSNMPVKVSIGSWSRIKMKYFRQTYTICLYKEQYAQVQHLSSCASSLKTIYMLMTISDNRHFCTRPTQYISWQLTLNDYGMLVVRTIVCIA